MKSLCVTLLIILLLGFQGLVAQSDQPFLLITTQLGLPTGDFGKDIGEDAHMTRRAGFNFGDNIGLARTGYGLGIELITPLDLSGFNWVLSGRVLFNGGNPSAADAEFSRQLGEGNAVQFTLGNWINIPFMSGFRYAYPLTSQIGVYGLVQAGINISQVASIEARIGEITAEKTSFSYTRDFGFEVAGGIDVFNSFCLGFRYLNLNTPRYEGTRELSERQFPEIFSRKNAIVGESRSISMVVITLGYFLFK